MARIGRSFPAKPLIKKAVPKVFTLKTVNGLTSTSIKTIQGTARASVKTYDGLTPP